MKKGKIVVEKQKDGLYCVIDTSIGVVSENIEDREMDEQEADLLRRCDLERQEWVLVR